MLLIYEASIFISKIVVKSKKNKWLIEEFEYRSKMNEKLFADNNKIVKRFLI
jgi:hypothetical protein